MIDTIKLSYPYNKRLASILEQKKSRLLMLSPNGQVEFEKGYVKDLPSHFSGLRIVEHGNQLFFEFSLQKWQSADSYNAENTKLLQDITALNRWIAILASYLGYGFDRSLFLLNRVDLAFNYTLSGTSYIEFFRCAEIHLGRSEKNVRRYGTTLYYGSQWVSKKIYHKYSEYKSIERPKRKRNDLHELYIDIKIIRFEIEFRLAFLKRKGLRSIESIGRLLPRYLEEERKFLFSVEKFNHSKLNLRPIEKLVCDYVMEKGYLLACEDFKAYKSRATWYRVKKQLKQRGIFLESLETSDLKDGEENQSRFQLSKEW